MKSLSTPLVTMFGSRILSYVWKFCNAKKSKKNAHDPWRHCNDVERNGRHEGANYFSFSWHCQHSDAGDAGTHFLPECRFGASRRAGGYTSRGHAIFSRYKRPRATYFLPVRAGRRQVAPNRAFDLGDRLWVSLRRRERADPQRAVISPARSWWGRGTDHGC